VLARVGKNAPADYDFPETRRALRGHEELQEAELEEVEIDGKRLLAAKVKTFDVGRRLVQIEGHGVRGTRPELVCSDARIVRVLRPLTYDLKTGQFQAARPVTP
jgi:hypothetical protein